MALGQFGAVRSVDQGHVTVDRHGPTHRLDDLQLARGIVEMIGAADHMRDAHVEIIDHDGEHIGRVAVAA